MSKNQRLAHLVLQTGRLQAMRDWYLAVLGAHVVHENPAMCFLTFDEEHHRLGLLGVPGLVERTPTTVGMNHSAYTFETLDDLLARYISLREQQIAPHVCVQHGPTTSFYYRDPDGNLAELQIDNFATPEETSDYLAGPEFSADFAGPALDPETLLAAYRAGTRIEVLTTRQWALSGPPMSSVMAALSTASPAVRLDQEG